MKVNIDDARNQIIGSGDAAVEVHPGENTNKKQTALNLSLTLNNAVNNGPKNVDTEVTVKPNYARGIEGEIGLVRFNRIQGHRIKGVQSGSLVPESSNNQRKSNTPPKVNDHNNEEKSQEEIAFEISYRKWENQLDEWKRINANHPDRKQYDDFVTKMEECQQTMMQRREILRQNRLAKCNTVYGLNSKTRI